MKLTREYRIEGRAHHVVAVHVHGMYRDIFVIEHDANAFTVAKVIYHPVGFESDVSFVSSK